MRRQCPSLLRRASQGFVNGCNVGRGEPTAYCAGWCQLDGARVGAHAPSSALAACTIYKMQSPLEVLLAADPLFAAELDDATSPWTAVNAILTAAQRRADELDDAAASRGAELLARVALMHASVVGLAVEHVLEGVSMRTPKSHAAIAEGAQAQRLALVSLLEKGVRDAALLGTIASAVAAQAARHGSEYETVGPTILGAAPLASLVHALDASGLPAMLQRLLASCADQKLRLRAIACASNVWARASAAAPEATPSGDDARALALRLVNVCVDSALYDPVGKVRLASTRLIADLAVALKPAEVLKLAMYKSRDKDAATRSVAVQICATVGGEEGIAAQLSAHEVHQLVLRAAGMGDEAARRFAQDTLLGFLVAHQAQPAHALVELRAAEQLELYEPLLAPYADRLFAAAFPDGLARACGAPPVLPRPQGLDTHDGPVDMVGTSLMREGVNPRDAIEVESIDSDEDEDVDDIEEVED